MESLNERIKSSRERMGLSLRQCAREIGVTATFLTDVEKGKRYPSDEVLERIGRVLVESFEKLKELDRRLPVKELQELVDADPRYAAALRKLAGSGASPEEIIKLAAKSARNKEGRKPPL